MINQICEKLYNKKFNFKIAFNHSSYANRNGKESNERLEFLGDSIINFYVTQWLFSQKGSEGDLSKIRAKMVSTSSFAKIADHINLSNQLRIFGNISAKTKANLVEAVIAEIYLQLDKKDDISKLIHYLIIDDFREQSFEDSKTVLQEILQKNKHYQIVYKTQKKESKFVAKVLNNGQILACGEGNNKKLAEKDAAKNALKIIKKEGK